MSTARPADTAASGSSAPATASTPIGSAPASGASSAPAAGARASTAAATSRLAHTKAFAADWCRPTDGNKATGDGGSVSDTDLSLINRYTLAPLAAADVYVRRMALCNDQVDRSYERFPTSYLQRFAETLPGKSLLLRHDKRGTMPAGRFYEAHVEQDAQGVNWLSCAFYCLASDASEEMRANIDAGVWRDVSIGFRYDTCLCDICGISTWGYAWGDDGPVWCPHTPGETYNGVTATATYGGDLAQVEAIEGSLVYLGCQYGSVLTKSLDDDLDDDTRRLEQALIRRLWPELKDAATRERHDRARQRGRYLLDRKETPLPDDATPETPAGGEFELASMTALRGEMEALAAKHAEICAQHTTLLQALASARALADDGELYRADLKAEIARCAALVRCEKEAAFLIEASAGAPAARLKELCDEYRERVEKAFPPTGRGVPAQPSGSTTPRATARQSRVI